MTRKILITVSLLIIVSIATLRAEVVNKIVAVINDEVITQSDLDKFFFPVKLKLEAEYRGKELEEAIKVSRKDLLGKMIQDKLLLKEVEKYNITVSQNRIMNKLEAIKSGFPTEEAFNEAVAKSGMSVDDLKKRYHEQLLIDNFIFKVIKSNIQVSPQEVTEYYDEHKTEEIFKNLERISLRQIFIPLKEDGALKKMKMVRTLLKQGLEFHDLAIKYSKGPNAKEAGLLGIRERGELMPEIDNVAFKLKEGEFSDIISTPLGYHIFKVDKKFPSQIKNLSEVRYLIKDIVFRVKSKKKFDEYLDNLYEQSYISTQE